MEVDCLNFRTLLPSILASISSSRFVSIDLELSGIPRRSPKTQNRQAGAGFRGKQSLQQRYAETKAAAERFHILQLGLTCVQEDKEEGQRFADLAWIDTENDRQVHSEAVQHPPKSLDR